ncbi:MAG: hypothetical protein Q9174_004406 [Haloplaca sp. 1 TL-2023]
MTVTRPHHNYQSLPTVDDDIMPLQSSLANKADEARKKSGRVYLRFEPEEQYSMKCLHDNGYPSKFIADVIYACRLWTILTEDMPKAENRHDLKQLEQVHADDVDIELEKCRVLQ